MRRCLVIGLLLLGLSSVQASTIHVPSEQPTIQAGIDAALSGDTVLVADGLYSENISFLGKQIVVTSERGPDATTIQASGAGAVVSFTTSEPKGAEISGFTITGGSGSGVFCDGSSPTIKGNIITGNTSSAGNDGGAIDLNNTTGAFIYGNLLHGNTADQYGAAFHLKSGSYNDTIAYNTIYDNWGYGEFRVLGTTDGLMIYNNTIWPSLYSGITVQSSGTVDIRNNIIFDAPVYGIARSGGATVVADYNCLFNNVNDWGGFTPGIGNIHEDPEFLNLPEREFALVPGSPCINAGDPDPIHNDPDGSRNDMGASLAHGLDLPYAILVNFWPDTSTHLLNHVPTFYWTYYDTVGSQVAFAIEVGTDRNWAVAEMWSPGEVFSADTSILYAGGPLLDGETYFFRLRVLGGASWGPWNEQSFRMNSRPSAPVGISPIGIDAVGTWVQLTSSSSIDAESDTLSYDFELHANPSLTDLVDSSYGVQDTITNYLSQLQVDTDYWWRVRAHDGYEYSDWSLTETFLTQLDDPSIIQVPSEQSTIQAGIEAAGVFDTVLVAAGVYAENISFVGKYVIVISEGGPDVTTIQASGAGAVVSFANSEPKGAEISGFTITGGNNAGIFCENSSPTITGNIITGNTSTGENDGGGIDLNNTTNSRIYGNVIRDNSAQVYGAAIHLKGGSQNDTIAFNTIYDNSGYGEIRMVWDTYGLVIHNNTIWPTTYSAISIQSSGDVNIRNNIMFNAPGPAVWMSVVATVTADYNCTFNNAQDYVGFTPGSGNIFEDALFAAPLNRNFTLVPESPCIDAGDPDPFYNDLDGSRNDMGASLGVVMALPFAALVNLGEETPSHVLNNTPTFYWTYFDIAGAQVAYIAEVGTDDDWSVAEMWSSGEIVSSDTSAVYAGDALVDGVTYFLRIRVYSGSTWGAWNGQSFRMNSIPTVPVGITPSGGVTTGLGPQLSVSSRSDAEDDLLRYDFEIHRDPLLTDLVDSSYNEIDTVSRHFGPLLFDTDYWWRVRLHDGYEYTDWSGAETFRTKLPEQSTIKVPAEQPTIQSAIDAASWYDTISVAPNVYAENITLLGKLVVIISEEGPEVTTIQASGTGAVVSFTSGEPKGAEIAGFTITGGNMSGVFCDASSPTIVGNIIVGNTSATDNVGGAISLNNTSGALIRENVLQGNTASTYGAAIHLKDGSMNDTIAYNTIYDNSGYGDIRMLGITEGLVIHNNTIWPTTFSAISVQSEGAVDIRNNIIFNAPDYAVWLSSEATVTAEYNCAYDNAQDYSGFTPGAGNIGEAPLFVDLPGRDFSLLPISPCIDAGDPDPKFNDPNGSRNDIGAIPWICTDSTDIDGDGHIACVDNCPGIYNPGQVDTDSDGVGDDCCCQGSKGSLALLGQCFQADQVVDIVDLTGMIDHLFVTFEPLCCPAEGDIAPEIYGGSADGLVGVDDLTALIDHLFINFPVLPECP